MRKHEENDAKCTELGWMCVLLAVESYSAWGVEACNAFSFLARCEAIITNSPKSKVLCDLFGRLSFILIQSNARAILARQNDLGSIFSFVLSFFHVCKLIITYVMRLLIVINAQKIWLKQDVITYFVRTTPHIPNGTLCHPHLKIECMHCKYDCLQFYLGWKILKIVFNKQHL